MTAQASKESLPPVREDFLLCRPDAPSLDSNHAKTPSFRLNLSPLKAKHDPETNAPIDSKLSHGKSQRQPRIMLKPDFWKRRNRGMYDSVQDNFKAIE